MVPDFRIGLKRVKWQMFSILSGNLPVPNNENCTRNYWRTICFPSYWETCGFSFTFCLLVSALFTKVVVHCIIQSRCAFINLLVFSMLYLYCIEKKMTQVWAILASICLSNLQDRDSQTSVLYSCLSKVMKWITMCVF